MNKILKNAFTLAELLIVLVVIGVMAILTLSVFTSALPDENKSIFKKTYSVLERTVSELINDEEFYPYDPGFPGFINNVPVKISTSTQEITIGTASYPKFEYLLHDKLNTMDEDWSCSADEDCSFTTTDGVVWTVEKGNFAKSPQTSRRKKITIDVNGQKGPNSTEQNNNKDQFEMYVYFDGKVAVEGELEKKYLTSHSLKKD